MSVQMAFTAGILLLGLIGVGLSIWMIARAIATKPETTSQQHQLTCRICQQEVFFTRQQLRRLSPEEKALAVSAKPALIGKNLLDLECPHCRASLVFVSDASRTDWVGVNLFKPQNVSARCQECGAILQTPPWPPGAYDGHLEDAPELPEKIGLQCSRCQSVCCVTCCKRHARGHAHNVKLICPRCSRYPIDHLYYPEIALSAAIHRKK